MTNDATRQTTLLKAAARAAKNITTILDPQVLFERTVDIICDEFGFYYAGVFLVDDTGQNAVLKAGRGEAGRTMIKGEHKLAIGGNSMIGASIANKQGRIALDVGAEAVFFENPHLPETRSEMALPRTSRRGQPGAKNSVAEAIMIHGNIPILNSASVAK